MPLHNPQTILRKFKTEIRDFLRKHERKHQLIIKEKIKKLSESLHNTLNDPSLLEDEKRISATHLKSKIQALTKDVHDRNWNTLATIEAADGERIGKMWSNRHKENKPCNTIKCLKLPNSEHRMRDSREMAKIAVKHHRDIQHKGHNPRAQPDKDTLNEILQNVKRRTSEDSKRLLAEHITEGEVQEAMRKTTNEKVPGPDGIPIDLWKTLDD